MRFEIDKPVSDSGVIVLIVKYITLFILSWLAGWILLLYGASKMNRGSDWIFDYPFVWSLLIAGGSIYFLGKREYRKAQFGEPFAFTFTDEQGVLTISTINRLLGTELEHVVPYDRLKTYQHTKNHPLFGEQRIIKFVNGNKLVAQVNLDFSAWVRHPDLSSLLSKIEESASR